MHRRVKRLLVNLGFNGQADRDFPPASYRTKPDAWVNIISEGGVVETLSGENLTQTALNERYD